MDRPEVFQGSESYLERTMGLDGPVVTIGNFDGVHRGHRSLLERAISLAHELHRPSCAYTFDPAPRDVLRPDSGILRIQTVEDRIEGLGRVGIDQVVIEAFDRDFAAREARSFALDILRDRLRVAAVVVGWDFQFGRGREGDVEKLRRWLEVPVEQIAPYAPDGRVVSSSRIREALKRGAVEDAAELLGHVHEVVGVVVPGDARGRRLGFPTANVAPSTPLIPGSGVYAVWIDIGDGVRRAAVANLGVRPTFDRSSVALEVHLLDWTGDLYDRRVRIFFRSRLREERRFESVDALVAQIRLDVGAARDVLSRAAS